MAICYHNSQLTEAERLILETLRVLLWDTAGAKSRQAQISKIDEMLSRQPTHTAAV